MFLRKELSWQSIITLTNTKCQKLQTAQTKCLIITKECRYATAAHRDHTIYHIISKIYSAPITK